MFILIILVATCLLLLWYMYNLAHKDRLEIVTIADENFPSSSESLNIFFISDVHKRLINHATLHTLEDVDMTIIGGDLCEKDVPLGQVEENIKRLKKLKAPIYFVWGNNDYEVNPYKLKDLLSKHNVSVLADSTERFILCSGERIQLVGLQSLYFREILTSEYFNQFWLPEFTYTILANHEPESYDLLNKEQKERVNLVLSGHTHGGQIRIFGFGLRSKGGWKKFGNKRFLVSEGYGTTTLPLRLGTKAECHFIKITNLKYKKQ